MTSIEWTDAVWNPVTGCSKVSEGCRHCYAETFAARLRAMGQPKYRRGFRVTLHPETLGDPLRWRKPRRVFVNSMSDLFHRDVPDWFLDDAFSVIGASPAITFQALTKRSRRMRDYMGAAGNPYVRAMNRAIGGKGPFAGTRIGGLVDVIGKAPWPPPNLWLGTSVEDQRTADERIPLLLETPAAVRWISAEPLLGEIRLRYLSPSGARRVNALIGYEFRVDGSMLECTCPRLDWVVCGGESGPGARPMDPAWARSLRDDCAECGVPFFFKQWGGIRAKAGGRLLDGREHGAMPAARSEGRA